MEHMRKASPRCAKVMPQSSWSAEHNQEHSRETLCALSNGRPTEHEEVGSWKLRRYKNPQTERMLRNEDMIPKIELLVLFKNQNTKSSSAVVLCPSSLFRAHVAEATWSRKAWEHFFFFSCELDVRLQKTWRNACNSITANWIDDESAANWPPKCCDCADASPLKCMKKDNDSTIAHLASDRKQKLKPSACEIHTVFVPNRLQMKEVNPWNDWG